MKNKELPITLLRRSTLLITVHCLASESMEGDAQSISWHNGITTFRLGHLDRESLDLWAAFNLLKSGFTSFAFLKNHAYWSGRTECSFPSPSLKLSGFLPGVATRAIQSQITSVSEPQSGNTEETSSTSRNNRERPAEWIKNSGVFL
jgi:hypothetical protein